MVRLDLLKQILNKFPKTQQNEKNIELLQKMYQNREDGLRLYVDQNKVKEMSNSIDSIITNDSFAEYGSTPLAMRSAIESLKIRSTADSSESMCITI